MKKTYDWNAVAVHIPHVFLELLQLRNMCYKAVLNNIFQVGVEKGEVLLGRKKLPCFQQLWWRAAGNRFITNKNVFKQGCIIHMMDLGS